MRLHPDTQIALREPELPGLAGVLDAPALAARAGLGGLRPSYLLYKPWTSCVAGLMPEGGGLEPWLAATYPQDRFNEVRARPEWQEGAIFLDDTQSVLVPLSLARKPKAAQALADPERRRKLLARVGLDGCALTLLRYKPGRRLVLRADGPEGPRAILKLHAREADFARAVAGAQFGAASVGADFIGACKRARAIATRWVPGHVLHPAAGLDAFVRAGGALAAAHAARPPQGHAPLTLAEPKTLAQHIGWLLPGLDADARSVARRMPPVPESAAVVLHGDFSADQIVHGPERMQIVDWDRTCAGPGAYDLGTALAALDLDGLRGADAAEAAGDALVAGYRAAGGRASDADIAACRARALLARADDGFRVRRPNWDVEAAGVLKRIDRVLDHGLHATAHLDAALDPRVLRPQFDASSATLIRLKPRRRALVRYRGPGGVVLGKMRAKGQDAVAPAVQAGLRKMGLDGRDGIGVPRVLGSFADPPLWLQEEVAGTPLGQLIDGQDAAMAMRRAGRALSRLHLVPPQSSRRWRHADELAVLSKAVADGPYADLATLAAERLAALPPAPEVGLHRDFYFDQVVVGHDILWLVDLDLHARGDAAIDVGNFLAHLTELDLRRGGDGRGYAALAESFVQGYAVLGGPLDHARIDLFHWLSLARHVAIARRFADRRHTVPVIAALCRAKLGRAKLQHA
ncbi:phosphotransferase [Actibacterium ureilyticum]|uniref:phosphotransferase n=1 Tax=Actibacterium ureilyticum TaxID=1590614 RepID=UPI0015957400|nr:phosphotransferase [Actibacterium ureilyticum]